MHVIRGGLSRSKNTRNVARWMLAVSALVVAVPATAVAAQTRPAHLQVATARANAGLSRDTRLKGAVLSLGGGYGTPSGSPLVRAMQRRLVQAGYTPDGIDGIFGPRTRQAVIAFQAAHGLQQDGVVGPRTWAALRVPALILGKGAGDEAGGSRDVRSLQRHLAAAGDRPGPVDGHYGPLTEAAVERFQQSHGLRVDGIAGPRMLALVARPAQPAHKSTPRPAHDSTPRPAHRTTPVSPAPRSNVAPAPVNRPATTARRAPAKPSHGTRSVPWIMLFGLALALACVLAFIVGVVSCVPRREDRQFSPASAASGGADPAGPERMELSPVGVDAAGMAASGAAVVRTNGHGATNGNRGHANGDGATPESHVHVEDAVATNATAATNGRGANGVVANGKGAKGKGQGAKGNGTGAKANGKGAHAADPGARANGMGAHANGEGAHANGEGAHANGKGAHGNGSGATDGAAPVANEDPPDLRRTAGADGAFKHGLLLEAQGSTVEAQAAYSRADENGHAAAANLGRLLEDQGAVDGEEAAYRRADERGDAEGAFKLGVLLEERKAMDEAADAYRRAIERGHDGAASNLGFVLEEQGEVAEAEAAYRWADDRGDATAAFNLGVLLEERNAMDEAADAYRRAIGRGDDRAASNLGFVLEEQGEVAEAEAAYRWADDRGDATAAFNLGVMLEERGSLTDAHEAYRRAEQRGDGDVANLARAALLELREYGEEAGAHNG